MVADLRRAGALCGIAGPLAFLALYAFAAHSDPEYVFFRNYLSDLGVGRAAWAFNSAVIIAGALTIPFVLLGVRPGLEGRVMPWVASVVFAVAATFLMLVGVFTEDAGDLHYTVSVGFFVSIEVGLGVLAWTPGLTAPLGRPVTEGTRAAFAVGVVLMALGFNPQTETVAVLVIVGWALAVSAWLLRPRKLAPTH